MEFEYKITTYSSFDEKQKLVVEFDKLGKNGWELCGVIPDGIYHNRAGMEVRRNILVFKRLITK